MSSTAPKLTAVPPPPENEENQTPENPEDDVQLTLWDHLTDLRQRLMYAAYGLFGAVVVCYGFHEQIFEWVLEPMRLAMCVAQPPAEGAVCDPELIFTKITDPLFVYIRVSVYAAAFLSAPNTLYQFWAFVSPGLYRREKRLVIPFVVLGTVFFVAGGLACRYFVMPAAFQVMLSEEFTGRIAKPMLSMGESLDISLVMLLTFGVIFELPLVLTLLAKLGIVKAATLSKFRRFAIVINIILAAIITPTGDPFNLLITAIPLIVFYELGIIGAKLAEKTNKDGEVDPEAEEPAAS